MAITVKVTFGDHSTIEVTADTKEDVAEMIDRASKKFFGLGNFFSKQF